MRNGGLMIGNAFESGIRAYGQLQSIDANKQAMGLRDEDNRMRKESHEAQMREQGQRETENEMRFKRLQDDEQNRALQLSARKMRALQGAGIEWTPENQKALSQYGRYADPEFLLSNETGGAIDVAESVLRGERDMNDPDAIGAYNRLLNVQRGATDGRNVSINRIYPSRSGQGIYLGLGVKNQDGTQYENGALTDRRSADQDDPVTELSMDELTKVLGTAKQMRGALSNPKMAQAFMDFYDPQKPDSVSPLDQSRINFNNSRAKYYDERPRDAKAGSGAGSQDPADIRSAKILQEQLAAEGKRISFDDAHRRVKTAVSDPMRYISDYVKHAVEDQDRQGIDGPDRKSRQVIEKEAISSYQQVLGMLHGGSQQSVKDSSPADSNAQHNQNSAPQAAIDWLKKNPNQAENFKAKYGYLPEGF